MRDEWVGGSGSSSKVATPYHACQLCLLSSHTVSSLTMSRCNDVEDEKRRREARGDDPTSIDEL